MGANTAENQIETTPIKEFFLPKKPAVQPIKKNLPVKEEENVNIDPALKEEDADATEVEDWELYGCLAFGKKSLMLTMEEG